MTANHGISPIVISGIGPLCPQCKTIEELLQTAFSGMNEATSFELGSWFDPKHFFGQRGFKYLTPATQYALAATSIALEDAGIQDKSYYGDTRGVVVGTNFGVFSVLDCMDQLVLAEGTDALSPMTAPNFSINLASSYISIKYGCNAYNITLTSPMVAGLEALIFGTQAIFQGRSEMAVVGATEDSPPESVKDVLGLPVGNGAACMFILETLASARNRQAKVYACVHKSSLRFVNPNDLMESTQRDWLKEMMRQELNSLLPVEQTSIHYCPLVTPFWFNQLVNHVVYSLLEERGLHIMTHNYVGASGAFMTVSTLLQLAGVVAEHGEGLILATSPYGNISMLHLSSI
jgi:hypothetical protein